MRRGIGIAVAGAMLLSAGFARADDVEPAPGLDAAAGTVIVSAERLVPIVTYDDDSAHEQTSATFGWGPLALPVSIQEVPRLAVDVAVTDRLTVGLAPVFTFTPKTSRPGSNDRFAFGALPRVGYVLPLSRRVAWWPHAGLGYLYGSYFDESRHHLFASADLPFVFGVAEHAALSLGIGLGAPITRAASSYGATNTRAFYVGLALGMVAWF